MKKGILLSLGALILIGVLVFAIWYISERREMQVDRREAFVPYNSAVVISVNEKPQLAPELLTALKKGVNSYQKECLLQITDSLQSRGYVTTYPYVMALRVQGKDDLSSLYVLDHKYILSKNEMAGFLNHTFASDKESVRKFERYKIYTLKHQNMKVYFAVCGNFILLSDSDLYIEDALKQFEKEGNDELNSSQYQEFSKYFSVGAGINVFLNTDFFSDLLPLLLKTETVFPYLDCRSLFKWGVLDGELNAEGISLNGFLQDGNQSKSYIQTLKDQQPMETTLDEVVPTRVNALGLLNLSDVAAYSSALENYRHAIGKKNKMYERKQQYKHLFGEKHEELMQGLLQGEFAIVELEYKEKYQEVDGLIIASLKSGSLGQEVLGDMVSHYARVNKKDLAEYVKQFQIDQQKSFSYYCLPIEDMPAVYWGNVFGGVKSRYVFVEDNYWIFASSEEAIHHFIRDYVHGRSVRAMSWYKVLKNKLARKGNLSYLAKTDALLPQYMHAALKEMKSFLKEQVEGKTLFPSWALQWSNEGKMLYSTLFLNATPIQEEVRPHVVWQTRLGGKVVMKPVSVLNHLTGERELFVQDEKNTIYLINDAGRILWQQLIDGKINSDVYQVDVFKNGKLQYLFSTPTKMYLIDRNGNAVAKFPLTFRSVCQQGITLCDYEQNKNYRVFVPCVDQMVYLYDLEGKMVKGWIPPKADNPIVSRVKHVRVADKDYIVYADRYRLYVLDRKGKERIKVSSIFDLPEQTELYLTQQKGEAKLVFPGKQGCVYGVDFTGKTEQFKVDGVAESFRMNIVSGAGDGQGKCVLTCGNQVWVTRWGGAQVKQYTLGAENVGYPYIYQFSKQDFRIGLTDNKQSKLFLLTMDGKISKGFPISGDSPFSIVFSGSSGFFLYAGTDSGFLIKYRVQR